MLAKKKNRRMVESKRSKCKKDSEKRIANIWHNTHRVKKKKREFISTKRISFVVVVVVVVYHSEQQMVKKKSLFVVAAWSMKAC